MNRFYKICADRLLAPMVPVPTPMAPRGGPAHPVLAVLFDIYGTLFISAAGDTGQQTQHPRTGPLLQEVLKDANLHFPAAVSLALAREIQNAHAQKKADGIDFPEIEIDRLWQKVLNTDDLQAARNAAFAHEMTTNPVWPMPGLEKLTEKIEQKKLAAGIVSNAQFYTPLLFEYFSGCAPEASWALPDLVFYSYRHGVAKPSPHLFDLAARALEKRGILPHQTLFVGNDMKKDMAPARAVGFQTVLFAGDARSLRLHASDPCCKNFYPDMVITDLAQLADAL
ncbi:HAD family hydrolase [Desulfosudis oleivorans]|uniref:Haloacid dehalogenase domain protein hydrolase n=1 Tax=Desulfosudis oleivorans (strain DSM 6200 / JCM 39069 / Hxd3) TaxID=96561 RepID=A8ZTN8_DESOH|nr:HAD family hydrolase [Desulfosudis oleivorans]ABW66302.1 Haloacid dehalogenase domain protein hydrolase [Desulfosudis oleivorans Hxd3]